jgi:hypothetical protein
LHRGHALFTVKAMQETPEPQQLPINTDQLSRGDFISELIQGIGKMAGLGLLWSLEAVRNVWFKTLDRLNIKARPRRSVSAFPPGSPRGNKAA